MRSFAALRRARSADERHRLVTGSSIPFAPEKNEALVRLAEFADLAAGAFGDEAKGKRWLTAPNAALAGATPLSLLASSYGAERVRRALSVIEYGGVA